MPLSLPVPRIGAARRTAPRATARVSLCTTASSSPPPKARQVGSTCAREFMRPLTPCLRLSSQPWDASRFLRTVLWFNPPPKAVDIALAPLRLLSSLLPGKPAAPRVGSMATDTILVDADTPGLEETWGSLDDVVMGGASTSTLSRSEGAGEDGGAALVFTGLVSTANNGGFASVRNRDWEPPKDATAASGLEFRVRGDGQRYKVYLRTAKGWDALAYGASFDTEKGVWKTVRLPFSEFQPIFRAKSIRNAPMMDRSSLRSVQLMLSKFEFDSALNPHFKCGTPCVLRHRSAVQAPHSLCPAVATGRSRCRLRTSKRTSGRHLRAWRVGCSSGVVTSKPAMQPRPLGAPTACISASYRCSNT